MDMPTIISVVDVPERIDRVLEPLKALAPNALITVQEVEVVQSGTRFREGPVTLMCRPSKSTSRSIDQRSPDGQELVGDLVTLIVIEMEPASSTGSPPLTTLMRHRPSEIRSSETGHPRRYRWRYQPGTNRDQELHALGQRRQRAGYYPCVPRTICRWAAVLLRSRVRRPPWLSASSKECVAARDPFAVARWRPSPCVGRYQKTSIVWPAESCAITTPPRPPGNPAAAVPSSA
jgi:hypothetical protein